MTNRQLKKQLHALEQEIPSLSKEDASILEQRLISRIKFYQFSQEKQSFGTLVFNEFFSLVFHPWRLAKTFGTVTAIFLMVVTLSVGSALGASFAGGPGEAFYEFKIAVQKMPLVLPPAIMSDQKKAEKELELAHNRKEEMEQIIISQENNQQKSKKIQQVAKELSKNIDSAQKRVEKISQNEQEQEQIVKIVNSVKDNVSEIKKSIDEVSKILEQGNIDGLAGQEIKQLSLKASKAELSTLGVLIDIIENRQEQKEIELIKEGQERQEAQPSKEDLETNLSTSEPKEEQKDQEENNKEQSELAVQDQNQNQTQEQEQDLAIDANIAEVTPNDQAAVDQTISNKEVKETIIESLEQNILSLEDDLSKATNIKEQTQEPKESVELLETESLNQEPEENQESDLVAEDDVILNVEELLNQEIINKQKEEQKEQLEALVKQSKERLAQDDLKGALKAIQQAREMLGVSESQGLQKEKKIEDLNQEIDQNSVKDGKGGL